MIIKKKSIVDNKVYVMDLDITQEQLDRYFEGRELIQDVFPDLRPDQREFIKTGITPDQWKELFGSPDDNEWP